MTLTPSRSRSRRSSGMLLTCSDQLQTPIARGSVPIFFSLADRPIFPYGWEKASLQFLAGLHFHPLLHQVSSDRLVAGVAGHVVDRDRGASAVGAVRRAAVPREAVVEHHLALAHR